MVERIYGNIHDGDFDLKKKYDKYKPYTYHMFHYRSILPKNGLLLDSTSDIEIKNLSDTIEFLYLHNYRVKTPVIKWPTNLVAITLHDMFGSHSSDWMLVINQLPTTLKVITIYIFDKKLSNYTINWPPNLEVLHSNGYNLSSETISTLPVSLKLLDIVILYLDETKKYNTYFDNLPSQLEILKINLYYNKNTKYFTSINNLPNSIQYLSLQHFDYDILKFPNNLKYLELFYANKFNDNIIENIKKYKTPDEIAVDIVW